MLMGEVTHYCYIYLSSVFRSVWTTTELLFVSVGCGDGLWVGDWGGSLAGGDQGNLSRELHQRVSLVKAAPVNICVGQPHPLHEHEHLHIILLNL
jgi:hypothetical protein